MKFSFSWAHFKAPTPPMIAKFGNALVSVSTGTAIPVAFNGHPWVGGVIFALGAIGRFLASFFTDEASAPPPKP